MKRKKVSKTTATIILLDVGKGMDGGPQGATYLEQAIKGVSHLVEERVLHPASGVEEHFSIVLFGARETKNNLSDMGYDRVYVLQEMAPVNYKMIGLIDQVSPGERDGDFVDALIVALDIFINMDVDANAAKRVWLITGAYSRCNTSDFGKLVDKFVEHDIRLNVLGANFWEKYVALKNDDEEDEEEEQGAGLPNVEDDDRVVPLHKKRNEAAIMEFIGALPEDHARFHTLEDGVKLLTEFLIKGVRQVPTFSGNFEFGDVQFPVKMFLKAKAVGFPSLKKLSGYSQLLQQQNARDRAQGADMEDEDDEDDVVPSMAVKMERDYVGVIEPDRRYERKSLVRGYRYGKTLVPFRDDDLSRIKYKAERTLQVLGFALRTDIDRSYFMGPPELVVPPAGDDAAQQAVASLCIALKGGGDAVKVEEGEPGAELDRLERVALVRLVKQKSGGPPRLGCLLPCVKEGRYYGFYFHQLPFAEDVRPFEFPPLINEKPLSSKTAVREAWCESPVQHQAMGQLIDALDLDDVAGPTHTPNPATLHLYEALRMRATVVPATVGEVVDPSVAAQLPPVDGQPALSAQEAHQLPGLTPAVREALEPAKPVWETPDARAARDSCAGLFAFEPGANHKKATTGKRAWQEINKPPVSGGAGDGAAAGDQHVSNAPPAAAAPPVDNTGGFGGAGGFGFGFGAASAHGTPLSIPDLTSYRHDDALETAPDKATVATKRGKKDPKLKITLNQLLQGSGVDTVGTVDPCGDFRAMIDRRDVDKVEDALEQMSKVIHMLIADSVHGHLYEKAILCMQCMREGCVQETEAEYWNTFVRALKQQHFGSAFWQAVVAAKVTLISDDESGDSDVGPEEAIMFLSESIKVAAPPAPVVAMEESDDDLFGQME